MSLLGWIIGYAALASGLWAASAFLFRLRHAGRLVATIGVPAVLAGTQAWLSYLAGSGGGTDDWAPVFLILSLFVGGAAGMAALPVWYVFEERLGWRAP